MAIVFDPDNGNAKRTMLLSCLMSLGGGCCEQDQRVCRGRTVASMCIAGLFWTVKGQVTSSV